MSSALRSIIIGAYFFGTAPNISSNSGTNLSKTINVVNHSSQDSLSLNININLVTTHQYGRESGGESLTAAVWEAPSPIARGIIFSTTRSQPLAVVNSESTDHYKIVCNLRGWGRQRFLPEHIDHTLCTHVSLGYVTLDESSLTIKANPSWLDVDNPFHNLLKSYKQRGIKVILALGGLGDSADDKYSRMVRNATSRQTFITHALGFLEANGFDGLHIVWIWPVCWNGNCNAGPPSDREDFSLLVMELSSILKPRGLLLSVVVSPLTTDIDKGYDLPVLAEFSDWISVLTYNYFGSWNGRSGHTAPLYDHPDTQGHSINVNYTIKYLMSKGVPSRKIIMGIPLHGQAFTINNPVEGVVLNVPAGVGEDGGALGYYEICERIHNRSWTVVKDPLLRIGPYAYKGNQLVSFDDAEMVRHKAQYIRDMDLGGGMVTTLEQDDFQGICGEGKHPLMRALKQILSDPMKEEINSEVSFVQMRKNKNEQNSNGTHNLTRR